MRRLATVGFFVGAGAAGLLFPARSVAQDSSSFLSVGETAPNIEVVGATRYGALANPVHLSDFKGNTVVIAFFFKARSPG